MTLENTALKFQNVHKKYGDFTALKNVTFEVKEGEFIALLGPNGAGKTTLINCLNGLTSRNGGEISVFGEDPEKNPLSTKMNLGIVEQELVFDPFFTPLEMLRLRRGLFGLKPDEAYVNWLLEKLSLEDKKKVRARELSGGMKRRLMIAKALAHEPKILILDEPTAGVDVELRNALYDFLRALRKQGLTIVLTTHYLEEAELLADRVAIQNLGETVVFEDTKKLLATKNRWLCVEFEDGTVGKFELKADTSVRKTLDSFGSKKIKDLKIQEPNLEEIFLEFTHQK